MYGCDCRAPDTTASAQRSVSYKTPVFPDSAAVIIVTGSGPAAITAEITLLGNGSPTMLSYKLYSVCMQLLNPETVFSSPRVTYTSKP